MLNLHYNELIGKTEEWEGKKYLIVDDYTLDKVLDKIKRISIINLEDNKIMISTDDIIFRRYYFKKCCHVNDMCY